jgi:hypothetical protein
MHISSLIPYSTKLDAGGCGMLHASTRDFETISSVNSMEPASESRWHMSNNKTCVIAHLSLNSSKMASNLSPEARLVRVQLMLTIGRDAYAAWFEYGLSISSIDRATNRELVVVRKPMQRTDRLLFLQ